MGATSYFLTLAKYGRCPKLYNFNCLFKVVPASNANLVHHDSVIAAQSSVVGKLPLTRKASPMQLPPPNETAEQQRMRASSTGSAGSSGNNSNSGRNKLLQQPPPNSRDNASPVSYVSTASSGSNNNNNNNIQQVNKNNRVTWDSSGQFFSST